MKSAGTSEKEKLSLLHELPAVYFLLNDVDLIFLFKARVSGGSHCGEIEDETKSVEDRAETERKQVFCETV